MATLKIKQTSIVMVRHHLRTVASLPTPTVFCYPLPLKYTLGLPLSWMIFFRPIYQTRTSELEKLSDYQISDIEQSSQSISLSTIRFKKESVAHICHICSWDCPFKGTQALENFEFFLPKSKPYMPLVNFCKKFCFFSFDFRQILMFEHFRGDWAYVKLNFFGELSNFFFSLKCSLWSY